MRLFCLTVIVLSLPQSACFLIEADAYDGYRHEKTVGALPEGAPLPDYEVPRDDNITAKHAYDEATKPLSRHSHIEATEYFERAIHALRRNERFIDKKLMRRIVLDYGTFLRSHQGVDKAKSLVEEFLNARNTKQESPVI